MEVCIAYIFLTVGIIVSMFSLFTSFEFKVQFVKHVGTTCKIQQGSFMHGEKLINPAKNLLFFCE